MKATFEIEVEEDYDLNMICNMFDGEIYDWKKNPDDQSGDIIHIYRYDIKKVEE